MLWDTLLTLDQAKFPRKNCDSVFEPSRVQPHCSQCFYDSSVFSKTQRIFTERFEKHLWQKTRIQRDT